MALNFAYEVSLFVLVGFFNMPYKFTTWDPLSFFLPKEAVQRICIVIKIHRPRLGLNPRTFGPMASTLITKPLLVITHDINQWHNYTDTEKYLCTVHLPQAMTGHRFPVSNTSQVTDFVSHLT
jgi:hypothetical protein